jgi:hypothetical protein
MSNGLFIAIVIVVFIYMHLLWKGEDDARERMKKIRKRRRERFYRKIEKEFAAADAKKKATESNS